VAVPAFWGGHLLLKCSFDAVPVPDGHRGVRSEETGVCENQAEVLVVQAEVRRSPLEGHKYQAEETYT
jgi:hypothetical protein